MTIRLRNPLIIAAVAAVLTACAQPGQKTEPATATTHQVSAPGMRSADARMPRMQRMTPEQRQAWFQQRFVREAEVLKITPAQRPQWDAYVKAHEQMRASKPMMSGNRADWMKKMQAMTPDQRLEFHAAQMREHAKQMDSVAAASRKLRAALSPEQRKTFDAMYARHDGARGPQGRGEWRGRGMPPVPPASAGMMPPPAAQ